ncbi:MAG TPA: hypothetical protein PK971_09800 [Saprospiraceae bacterium]|nr:hypothetical protein [Saprospiraceae bacterium]HND88613.1 hypothetical protein [Saprospiraceae bacterium]
MSFAELILDPVFRLIVFAILLVIGTIIGWTLRAKFPERVLQRALERAEVEKSTLARLYAHLRNQHDLREADFKKSQLEVISLRDSLAQLQAEHTRHLPDEEQYRSRIEQAELHAARFAKRMGELDAQNRHLLERNQQLDRELARLQEELNAWQVLYHDFKNLQQRLLAFEQNAAALEAERDQLQDQLAAARAELERLHTELLQQANRQAAERSRKGSIARHTDDLKSIKGISPLAEQQLFALGIHTLEQISRWDDDTVIATARKLGISPGKIFQEDWVGQATLLMGSR